jgi:hypothetical protein
MKKFEDIKQMWECEHNKVENWQTYDENAIESVIKSRIKLHKNTVMKYFWTTFILQLTVYAIFSHLFVKSLFSDTILWSCLIVIILFIPFTSVLLKKYKAIAVTKLNNNSGTSIKHFLQEHKYHLESFYKFKKRYEFVLVPVCSGITAIIYFQKFVNQASSYKWIIASIIFISSSIIWYVLIRWQNKKSFEQPLNEIDETINEFTKDV